MDLQEFGWRLRQARKQRRLTITELSRRANVDWMQISRYEKGQHVPSFDRITRIADVLEVPLDVMAGRRGMPELPPAFRNKALLERMWELDALPAERQALALRLLEAVIAGELDAFVRRLRSEG